MCNDNKFDFAATQLGGKVAQDIINHLLTVKRSVTMETLIEY